MQDPAPDPSTPDGAPRVWRDAMAAGSLALALRLAHAAFLSSTPFFRGPIIDSATYHRAATSLAAGAPFTEPFYQPPLYVWALSLLYRLGLGPGWGVALVQSLLGAACCALLVVAARGAMPGSARHRRRVGLVAGLAAAMCGPLILFDLEMLPPVLVDLLLVGALAITAHGPPKPSVRDPIAGALLGTAATGWVPALALVPALVLLRRTERRWLVAVLVVLGALPPLLVTAHHNATHGAPGTLVSWNGGLNLWIGNNPDWRDTWRARPGAEFEPLAERPRREGATAPIQQDRWFQHAAWADVSAHPGDAALRSAEKLYYAWHGREIRRNQDFGLVRELSPVLAMLQWELGLFFPFGLIAPLALLAAWRHRRERGPMVLFGTALAYSLAMAAFFVASRYRLPMLLLLLPLAADTVARWAEARRIGKRELAGLAALLVALNLPMPFTASFAADRRERLLMRASAWQSQGNVEEAERIADALLARHPDDANVQMLRATLYAMQGRCERAVPHLERVAALAPLATTPWIDIAHCLAERGDVPGAERAYAHALAIDPHHPQGLRGAAVLYMDTNRAPNAIMLLARLREGGQSDDGTDFDLGRLLIEEGRTEEAREVLEPLARRRPDDADVRALLAQAGR